MFAASAQAHHSLANYDESRRVELEGVISEFSFTNPHPFLVIRVGKEQQSWRLEMDNLFELVDAGMTKATFRPGDRVTVTGAPDRQGARLLYLRRLDRPADGLRYEQVGFQPFLRSGPATSPAPRGSR